VTQGVRPATRDGGGLLYGVAAYSLWGVFPAFFSLLAPAGAPEILAHRIVWTVLLMAVVLVAVGRLGDLRAITGRSWLLLAIASALISTNWLIFIFAVNEGHVVDAALGYFISPLVSVVLGLVIFRERLNRVQIVAVLLAAAGVMLLSSGVGGLPWIGVGLALSFALYGSVKKVVPTDPRVSVAVEAAIAAPLALVYLTVLAFDGDSDFTNNGPVHVVLMLLCGPVTALPLLCFAAAAQRLPLVTLGLLQYLTPSMQMIWGVLIGHEPMPPARWLGFGMIWVALIIFSTDAISRAYRNRPGTLQAS
jgi:chloramphenicol-sensitive protein RarD